MNRRQIFASDYDALGPDVPEAVVALVDALRDYIEAEKNIREELSLEGSLTAADCERLNAHLQPYRLMLKHLEQWQINPTLNALLELKR